MLSTPRSLLGVAGMNGVLYAVGGYTTGISGAVEAYDPLTDSWGARSSMPTLRASLGVGVVSGRVYSTRRDVIPE